MFKKFLFILFLILVFASVSVGLPKQPTGASWTMPTTMMDGTPLDPGELAGSYFYWRDDNEKFDNGRRYKIDGASQVSFADIPEIGDPIGKYIAVTAFNINGKESELTNEVLITPFDPKAPGVPGGLIIDYN